MNFSKTLAIAAVMLVGSLALITEAGGPYRSYPPSAPAHHQHRSAHGPYHSYAVRPAIYGGPRLYTYRGYARHPLPPKHAAHPAPVAVHLKAAAYSPYSTHAAPLVAPLTLAIEAPAHSQYQQHGAGPIIYAQVHAAAPAYAGSAASAPAHHGPYGLRPVKAVLLAPIVAPVIHQAAAPLRSAKTAYGGHHSEPAAAYPLSDSHAALAGPLFNGEAPRPASYGAGHYYQALETLKSQGHRYHNDRQPEAGAYRASAGAPSGGAY